MPRPGRRRLLTVLFLDIVGSTALANELGDARWRVVLSNFHDVVRTTLRRNGGHYVNTTGDGVLATFTEPVRALRAAAALTAAVQDLGLDVRVGVHTGECEEIDGNVGGVAVHIGARVMALASAAEVMATSTVRELVSGSGATFDDAGEHELKGIPGRWHVFGLTSIDVPLPAALAPEVAASRLERASQLPARRRPWWIAAVAAIVVAAALGGYFLTRGAGHAHAAGPIGVIGIDPNSGKIVSEVHDRLRGCPCGANLYSIDGTLWEKAGQEANVIALRDMQTGKLLRTTSAPVGTAGVTVGFGSVWLMESVIEPSHGTTTFVSVVRRLDELSGRQQAAVKLAGPVGGGAIEVGNGAVWVLQPSGTLDRIDPTTNRVMGRYQTTAVGTILLPTGGYEWVCECDVHEVYRYDARTRSSRTFRYPEEPWHLVTIPSSHGNTMWLLDTDGATMTQLDASTGQLQEPLGLEGAPTQAVEMDGAIWVAAGNVVDRVSLPDDQRTAIKMPPGVNATGIAGDPVSGRLWVDNSYLPPPP